jgi:hypothetical protein
MTSTTNDLGASRHQGRDFVECSGEQIGAPNRTNLQQISRANDQFDFGVRQRLRRIPGAREIALALGGRLAAEVLADYTHAETGCGAIPGDKEIAT